MMGRGIVVLASKTRKVAGEVPASMEVAMRRQHASKRC